MRFRGIFFVHSKDGLANKIKARILKTDWRLPEEIFEETATFEIAGSTLQAFSCHEQYLTGENYAVSVSQIEKGHSWDERFNGNPAKWRELASTGDWSYDGYGQIISVNPIVADFGDVTLELGNWTNDENITGSHLFWPISQLRMGPNKDI